MAVVCSGNVTQSVDAKTLTFTDSGTGYGPITSRTLVINDAYGNPVGSAINMGVSLTAPVSITKDVWYSFVLTVTDNVGTYTCTVNYRSTQFYNLAQIIYTNLINCGRCKPTKASELAHQALECIYSSQNNFNIGDSVACQTDLDNANILINKAIC